jgi:hypothetical protein
VISDIVIACSEVWVVASRDYLASWWTQGELVCRLYAQGRALLRVYSPTARKVAETPASFQAALSEAQEKRLARLFANSHPSLMAPESMEAMRLLRPTRLPMPNDDVFSESFWNVPLLQCVQCSLAGGVPDHLDVGSFLRNSSPRLYPVPPDELAECAGTGRDLLCPNGCGTRYTVRSLAPRYLWYPLPVGPHKAYLESVPAFQAIPAGVSRR